MYSKHCIARNQQRAIPPIVHIWLSDYGEEIHDGRGAVKVTFTKNSIRRMENDFGRHFVRENKKYLDVYRVESLTNGCVITVGRLKKRIKK